MTWARVLATGSGAISWRLSIDGCPVEAVSSKSMEGTGSDGRTRNGGLRSEDFRFNEAVDLVRAKYESQGFSVSIADVDRQWTAVFSRRARGLTYLEADADDTDTTLTVKSTAGFPSSGQIWLNTEVLQYSGKTATTFTGLTRGIWQSRAQYHYTAVSGENQRFVEVSDWIQVYEGRRARLYAYGPGDSPTGNGTQVFVGVVRTSPRYSGDAWSLMLDPLASLLDQDIGSDLDAPTTIRGIYYPASAPLVVELYEHATEEWFGSAITAQTSLALAGFWESQVAFIEAFNTALAAAIASPESGTFTQTDVRGVADGDSWALRFVTDGADPRYLSARAFSAVDWIVDSIDNPLGDRLVGSVDASTAYYYRQSEDRPGLGTVPRTTFGNFEISYLTAVPLPAARQTGISFATNPPFRLYLASGVTTFSTAVAAEWESSGASDAGGGEPFTTGVATGGVDVPNGALTLSRPSRLGVGPGLMGATFYSATSASLPEIRLGRDYAVGSLADFLTALTAGTAELLNTGSVPDLWSGDIDMGDLAAAAGGSPLARNRVYSAFGPLSLRDVIEGDCKLLGTYPCAAADGRITFRRLRVPAQSEVASRTLDASTIIVSDQFLSFEPLAIGLVNTVEINDSYNPVDDSRDGSPIRVRDVAGFGLKPVSSALTIEPYSVPLRGRPRYADVVQLAARVLGTFGGPYEYITLEVPLGTAFACLLGSVASITYGKVPDDGELGVTERLGIVVSRRISPMQARGEVTIYTTSQRVAGYAPSALATGITGTSGTTGPFTLTLSANYFPAGTTADQFFEAGYKIRVFRRGSTTPGIVLGTVDSASANTVTITMDANWTHAGSAWVLGFQVASAITSTGQRVYCYLAGSDGDLDWSGSADNPPFTFAP